MTVAGAVWLVLTQSIAFAAGGFVSARLRVPATNASPTETRFDDGANGFMAWAIGAFAVALVIAIVSTASIASAARVGTGAASQLSQEISSDQFGYFVDSLLRTPQGRQNGTNDQDRAQVTRILGTAIRNGRLSEDDKTYLAGLVAARSGVSQGDAQTRVQNVADQARDAIKQVTETARHAGEYVAFWTFMSLLVGAVAATLGGLLGGELRDESSNA
jgi:hypothetical protein